MTFAVYARPLKDSKAKPEKVSEHPDYNSALEAATNRHVKELWSLYDNSGNSEALYKKWLNEGTFFYLEPDTGSIPFNVFDCGPLLIIGVTGDTSRPLLFEITCTDALRFATGGMSTSKQWKFYAKAPVTYSDASHLLKRAVERIYKEMSATAMDADGSSYVLQNCDIRQIDEAEYKSGISDPSVSIYTVQDNGVLKEQAHFLRV